VTPYCPSTMHALLIFAALTGVALSQVPLPCVGPASFTARFRHFNRERKYFIEGKMYYDEVNKRIREFEFEDINSTKEAYDKLKLYNLNTEYTVDLKTRKCNVTGTHHSWRPYGVPPFASYKGQGTLGSVGTLNEEVTISLFEGQFDENATFFVTVTEPDCFVVEMGVFSKEYGFEHREFYDVISGIEDPAAFVPPEACL